MHALHITVLAKIIICLKTHQDLNLTSVLSEIRVLKKTHPSRIIQPSLFLSLHSTLHSHPLTAAAAAVYAFKVPRSAHLSPRRTYSNSAAAAAAMHSICSSLSRSRAQGRGRSAAAAKHSASFALDSLPLVLSLPYCAHARLQSER